MSSAVIASTFWLEFRLISTERSNALLMPVTITSSSESSCWAKTIPLMPAATEATAVVKSFFLKLIVLYMEPSPYIIVGIIFPVLRYLRCNPVGPQLKHFHLWPSRRIRFQATAVIILFAFDSSPDIQIRIHIFCHQTSVISIDAPLTYVFLCG